MNGSRKTHESNKVLSQKQKKPNKIEWFKWDLIETTQTMPETKSNPNQLLTRKLHDTRGLCLLWPQAVAREPNCEGSISICISKPILKYVACIVLLNPWLQVSAGDLHAFDSLNLSPLAKVIKSKIIEWSLSHTFWLPVVQYYMVWQLFSSSFGHSAPYFFPDIIRLLSYDHIIPRGSL